MTEKRLHHKLIQSLAIILSGILGFGLPISGVVTLKTSAEATSPTITPQNLNLEYGYTEGNVLSIEAETPAGHSLTYQWYSNTSASNENGTIINEATDVNYTVPTGKAVGTVEYYYCEVTATNNNNTSETAVTKSAPVTVTITKANITPAVSLQNWTYGEASGTPVITGNTGNGDVTYAYKPKGAGDEAYLATVPTAAGQYTVRAGIAETDNYNAATATADFAIIRKSVTVSGITAQNKEYDGTTAATLVYSGMTITGKRDEDDLTATATGQFSDADPGENKTVTISGITLGGTSAANYVLAGSGNQTSTTASITGRTTITPGISLEGWTYGESAKTPVITGNTGNGTTTIRYKVSTADDGTYTTDVPTNAGNYTVRVDIAETATSTAGQATANFSISPKDITGAEITLGTSLNYTGSVQTQTITSVTLGNRTLTEGTDYEVSGNTATEAGTHTLTITGKGNYSGTQTKEYTITARNLSGVYVMQSGSLTYNGSSQAPSVYVGGDTSGVTISYSTSSGGGFSSGLPSFKDAGSHNVYFKAEKTGYRPVTGMFSVVIKKKKIGIEWSDKEFAYDGRSHAPVATATGVCGSDSLSLAVSGTGTEPGTYTATVTAINGSGSANYSMPSDRSCSFTITGTKKSEDSDSSKDKSGKGKGSKSSSDKKSDSSGSEEKRAKSVLSSLLGSGKKTDSNSTSGSTSNGSSSGNEKPADTGLSVRSANRLARTTKLADEDEAAKAVFGDTGYEELLNTGKKPSVRLGVKTMSVVPEAEKKAAEAGIGLYATTVPNLKAGAYLDIDLDVSRDGTWESVTETSSPIKIVIDNPSELMEITDTFYVLRLHEGEATLLYDMDDVPETTTISSDRFSTYVLMYQEEEAALSTSGTDNEAAGFTAAGESGVRTHKVGILIGLIAVILIIALSVGFSSEIAEFIDEHKTKPKRA